MGNYRPLPRKCWEAFLIMHGFKMVRVKGDHFQWTKKGARRPIPVLGDDKDIPPFHMKNGCGIIGVRITDLYAWAANNC